MNMPNKYNISSKEIISKLKEMNIEVTNHMTTIEDDAMKKLDGIYKTKQITSYQQQALRTPVQKQLNKVQLFEVPQE